MEVDNEPALHTLLLANERVVALFYASWCPFCRVFLPVFHEVVQSTDYTLLLVQLDDLLNPLWETYDVNVIPTVLFFETAHVTRRLDGGLGVGLSRNQLEAFLSQ
jgi:thioredoxin 1